MRRLLSMLLFIECAISFSNDIGTARNAIKNLGTWYIELFLIFYRILLLLLYNIMDVLRYRIKTNNT